MRASPAGLLGVLQGYMPPDAFTFDTSGQLVMQTVIGGLGTLYGPLVGATVWLYLRDFLQDGLALGSAWKLVLGLVFVLLVSFLRRGILGGLWRTSSSGCATAARRHRTSRWTRPSTVLPHKVEPLPAKRVFADNHVGPVLQTQRSDQTLRRPHRQCATSTSASRRASFAR